MLVFATEPFGTWGPGPEPLGWPVDAWVLGFFVSLIVGGVVMRFFVWAGRQRLKKTMGAEAFEREFNRKGSVPGWIPGLVERAFFTLAVAVDPPATIPAMIGWLGVKLAANWQRTPADMPL